MTKQKTAMQSEIDRIANRLAYLGKRNSIESSTLRIIKRRLENALPTEREQMIDFAQKYKSHCFQIQKDELPDSARTIFTNTFINYE